jgi:ketosteroid isomerase-like protein
MTITSQDTETVRRFYAALAARDLSAAQACFARDATWHLPGNSPIAGDHNGWPAIRDDFWPSSGPCLATRSGLNLSMSRSGRTS